jgi:WhiB family transcriptional regulator, redox-sensing transcriptional regulator
VAAGVARLAVVAASGSPVQRSRAKLQSTNWWEDAACRGLDSTIFYPVSEEEAGAAKAVCAMCEVQRECLDNALENREREGVWGGATERDRRRILRQRRRARGEAVSFGESRSA